jgi:hypothetical protein
MIMGHGVEEISGSGSGKEGKGPIALKTKETEKPTFGKFELSKVDSVSWHARIQENKKNGTATDLNISINRHDGRIEFWQGDKYESISGGGISGEATDKSARLFFTQKAKLDEIEHFHMGMKLPKVPVLEEQMQGFLKSREVQKVLDEVNKEIEGQHRRTQEFRKSGFGFDQSE